MVVLSSTVIYNYVIVFVYMTSEHFLTKNVKIILKHYNFRGIV